MLICAHNSVHIRYCISFKNLNVKSVSQDVETTDETLLCYCMLDQSSLWSVWTLEQTLTPIWTTLWTGSCETLGWAAPDQNQRDQTRRDADQVDVYVRSSALTWPAGPQTATGLRTGTTDHSISFYKQIHECIFVFLYEV